MFKQQFVRPPPKKKKKKPTVDRQWFYDDFEKGGTYGKPCMAGIWLRFNLH